LIFYVLNRGSPSLSFLPTARLLYLSIFRIAAYLLGLFSPQTQLTFFINASMTVASLMVRPGASTLVESLMNSATFSFPAATRAQQQQYCLCLEWAAYLSRGSQGSSQN
jgi:hypothetical protein